MARERLYRQSGLMLVRATTDPGGLEPPDDLDLDADHTVLGSGRDWLARLWRGEIRAALRVASPALSRQIETVVNDGEADPRQVRRLIASVCSYLQRWQRRPTPFGLFAGIAAASVDAQPSVRFGQHHRLAARADARWLGTLIDDLERDPGLLSRLPVVVNSAGFVRGDRFVVPVRPGEAAVGRGMSRELAVRLTRPVRAALRAAARPVRIGELAEQLCTEFARASPDTVHAALAELVERNILITSLRAPMTTVDSLAHLIGQLEKSGAADLPGVADVAKELTAIHDELSHLNMSIPMSTVDQPLEDLTERMRTLGGTAQRTVDRVLAVDVAMDCELTVPAAVIREAETAATALLRLTPHPFGTPEWKDFHVRFRDRYGAGAVVPVRDIVADSGLGFPAGFLDAPRGQAARTLTQRDAALLALVQQAAVGGCTEVALTEDVIAELMVGDHTEMISPARVELAFEIHADSINALARGQFQLWVTGAPRPESSMAGRFANLLAEADQRRLADSYAAVDDPVVPAQLSFPPRREHNENIARTPELLSHVISVSEHRDRDPSLIDLDDLAVTADATQFSLVQISTGARVRPHALHALEASVQTPPLARFLAEVASARRGVYGPFDFGAARTLPFVPRVRYGRVVLSPARWLLDAADLPRSDRSRGAWETAFHAWRRRWGVPLGVVLCEGELRLPFDLDNRLHRVLLRTRLDRARRVEVRESGDHRNLAWAGRPCELLVALTRTPPVPTKNRPRTEPQVAVARGDALLPGRPAVVFAQLFGHPMRVAEILTEYMPHLLGGLADHVRSWWFHRHHDTTRPDTDHHLRLYLRLARPEDYGVVTAQLGGWAANRNTEGLLAHLNLSTYQPQNGRYGQGAAISAAEEVFAADSAAALAQISMVTRSDLPSQALAAASMVDLAIWLAGAAEKGSRWLIDALPQEQGKLDRSLREAALLLADTADDRAALRAHPGGETVAKAWERRREALGAYRARLADERDPATVLRSLLHDHHVRADGVDPDRERVTNRLARAAAKRQTALLRRGHE